MEALIQIDMMVVLEIIIGTVCVLMSLALLCVLFFQPRW